MVTTGVWIYCISPHFLRWFDPLLKWETSDGKHVNGKREMKLFMTLQQQRTNIDYAANNLNLFQVIISYIHESGTMAKPMYKFPPSSLKE